MQNQQLKMLKQRDWKVDLLAGTTQATLVTITGYPFDLVKARLQTRNYANSLECLKDIIKRDGLLGIYRGSAMPWLSHLIKRPIQFPVSEYLKNKLNSGENNSDNNNKKSKEIVYNYLIGGLTGLIGPVFGTPLQSIKIGMQTSDGNKWSNSYRFARHHVKEKGVRRLYRGFIPTAIKDSVFGMSFVGTYYSLRDTFGSDRWVNNFFNGAAAHCFTWFVFIPIDYVKTGVQKSDGNGKIIDVIKNGYKQGGIKVFWRGVLPACLRTIPVSGIAMTGYEAVRKFF